jgi:hypothetical protein
VFTGSYIGLEDEAALIRQWEVQLIPGLLQTEDYARTVIAMHRPEDDAQRFHGGCQERGVRLGLIPAWLSRSEDFAVPGSALPVADVTRRTDRAWAAASRW